MDSGLTCYKGHMPITRDEAAPKKSEFVGLKVAGPDKATLAEICVKEDRPLGYVARELMLRGLAAYGRDGLLKEPERRGGEKVSVPFRKEDPDPSMARRQRKSSGR
jgi:hypothetical protein